MAGAFKLPSLSTLYSSTSWHRPRLLIYNPNCYSHPLSPSPPPSYAQVIKGLKKPDSFVVCYRYRYSSGKDGEEEDENCSFDEAVSLFNQREYYKCHDLLEALWNKAEEPTRTLIHGILQCAVGFHHLFNKNHRGAMMELGEGLCKLRKMDFKDGPFYEFEQDIAAVLDFIYNTQIELAACGDDICVTMEQTERSYLLLGGYAAGQHLYHLQTDPNQVVYIVFSPEGSDHDSAPSPRVRLPVLKAADWHLLVYD